MKSLIVGAGGLGLLTLTMLGVASREALREAPELAVRLPAICRERLLVPLLLVLCAVSFLVRIEYHT